MGEVVSLDDHRPRGQRFIEATCRRIVEAVTHEELDAIAVTLIDPPGVDEHQIAALDVMLVKQRRAISPSRSSPDGGHAA